MKILNQICCIFIQRKDIFLSCPMDIIPSQDILLREISGVSTKEYLKIKQLDKSKLSVLGDFWPEHQRISKNLPIRKNQNYLLREISGVSISGNQILVTSLAGSLNVIERQGRETFVVKRFFPESQVHVKLKKFS